VPRKKQTMSEADRLRLVEQLTREQQEKLDVLTGLEAEKNAGELRTTWLFGRELVECLDEHDSGQSFIEIVAKIVGCGPAMLRKRIHFAQRFDDEEIAALLKLKRSGSGAPLEWSHVVQVLPIEDKDQRWNLLLTAASQGWSSKRFKTEVAAVIPKERRRPNKGRTPEVPKEVDGKISDIQDHLTTWTKRAALWADEKQGLLAAVIKEPVERLKEGWGAKLTSIAAQAEALEGVLRMVRDHAVESKRLLDKALSDGAATGPEEPEDKDPVSADESVLQGMFS